MKQWTRFMDMHSGGGNKEGGYEEIYIEAAEEEAKVIFYNKFGHNPERVSCTCCGKDYSIDDYRSLEQATAYDRNCRYDKDLKERVEESSPDSWRGKELILLEDYCSKRDVLIVTKDDIKDDERSGDVPEEGYVWQ